MVVLGNLWKWRSSSTIHYCSDEGHISINLDKIKEESQNGPTLQPFLHQYKSGDAGDEVQYLRGRLLVLASE